MNRASRMLIFSGALIALLAALGAPSTPAANGRELSAFYNVTEATDLGQQVRVSLQIRLINNTDADLTVTKVALRSVLPGPRDAERDMPLLLRAHKSSLVSQQFLVTRVEFERWGTGFHPRLFLRLQTADGQEITRTLLLSSGQVAPMGVE